MDGQRYRFFKVLTSLSLVAEVEVETVFLKTLAAAEVSGFCESNSTIVSSLAFIYLPREVCKRFISFYSMN